MRNMKFEDFFDKYIVNNGLWDKYCDEAYWDHDFNIERAFAWICDQASGLHITIIDVDSIDYGTFLYVYAYENTEKGLS